MRKLLTILLATILIVPLAWAQERAVTGTVTSSEDGMPLPGVSVLVKGTTIGAVSDVNGNYKVNVLSGSDVLIFSFIGYNAREVAIGSQSKIDVVMDVNIAQLQEIVVTGYGSQVKRDVTGAITQVKAKDIVNFKAPSVDAMLQGQGTGIQVNQATGVPGGPVRVMIRGTSSVSSGTEPLWVIDGIPVDASPSGIGGAGRGTIPQNPLAAINPNDIESIEVLKDAAATAIYGSRGSNGVILVTTKNGKGSTGTISVDYQAGVTSLTKTPEQMGFANSSQWLDLINLSRNNIGLTSPIQDNLNALTVNNVGPVRLNASQLANTFWFDEILRDNGGFQEVNVSSSKGFDKGSMFISGNYRKDDGILRNNAFERASFRANLEYEPMNDLKVGVRLTSAYTKNQMVLNGGAPSGNDVIASGGFGAAATTALPIYPVFAPGEAGVYFNPTSGSNLAATYDRSLYRSEFQQYRMLGGVYADYNIKYVKGLSVRTEWSADIQNGNRLFWAAATLRPVGINYSDLNISTTQNFNYNFFSTYNRKFGTDHDINIVAGVESQRFSGRGANLFGEGIPGLNQDFGSPTAPITRAPSAGFGGERYIRGYFSRVNYKFKDRYLVGGSFRRDGVSIFTPENRWSNFAAASVGWIISEESFLKSVDFVNLLKLRGSFGQTGNQNIDPNTTFLGTVDWPRYGSAAGSQIVNRLAVTTLTWETTNAYDVGLDFELFNNRISGSVGYYRQEARDLLFQVPVAPSVGLNFGGNNIWANVGDMRNHGLELSLNTVNLDINGFRWTSNFNFTTNDNRLTAINPELDARGQGIVSGMTRNISGRPISTFFTAEYAGIDPQTGVAYIYEIDVARFNATGETVKTGNVIPASGANIQNNRILQDKTGLPKFFGGVTNSFSYKGFELMAMFTFQGGNWIYDNPEVGNLQPGLGNGNLRTDLIGNTWTAPGQVTPYPRLMWNNRQNLDNFGLPIFLANGTANYNQDYGFSGDARALDRYLYRGDFLRLRTLQVAYTLPSELISKMRVKNMRVFVAGNNLLTITGYRGWDPEILNFGGIQARNLEQGSAGNILPQLRTWTAGLSLTF